jgi:Flp pilus assembly pilin Flp
MRSTTWFDSLRGPSGRERGQTTVEYGVVLAVVTLLCVGIFTDFANAVQNVVNATVSLFT